MDLNTGQNKITLYYCISLLPKNNVLFVILNTPDNIHPHRFEYIVNFFHHDYDPKEMLFELY